MPHFEAANSNTLECRFNRLSRENVYIFNLQVFIVKDKILTFDIKEIVRNTLSTLMDINKTNTQNLLPHHLAFHGMGFYFKRPLSGKYRWKDMPTFLRKIWINMILNLQTLGLLAITIFTFCYLSKFDILKWIKAKVSLAQHL